MKKPLKLRRFVPVALLLVLAVICGSVFAYMFHRTEEEDTTFAPATVSCKVAEEFNGTEKSSITVQNTSNIPAYLRVRLVTYWVDGEGNVAAKSSRDLSITPAKDWIAGEDNTFYYAKPVAPGASTPELLASGTTIVLTEENGFLQVVDVFAEAIQAEPTKAVTESWKVTVDGDGNITGMSTP